MDGPLHIKGSFSVPPHAIMFSAIRASGPGGQSVNKTSSAVQLRCDLNSFYIPDMYRQRIEKHHDSRITNDGVVVIKAQSHRVQGRNREDALKRLKVLLQDAIHVDPPRRKTRPTLGSRKRAAKKNKRRSEIKQMRRKPGLED